MSYTKEFTPNFSFTFKQLKTKTMKTLILLAPAFLLILSCGETHKDGLNDFKEVNITDLTADNKPQGLELRGDEWHPESGWEIVSSKDGHKAMLLHTGSDTGSAGFECKCNSGAGKCGVRSDIVMCKADECTDCKTVLKIYNQPVKINRANW